ncbi:GNAT family N-acetyltransferase [Vicingaceae bacterium]|nr:GNAT family N-acetyltransferase [Vicingaceae bacterium]
MIIRKYGLEIREVEREDLELIRQYRNTESIKKRMIFKDQISRSQQLKWFEEIQSMDHFYFLIYKNDTAIGLINGKNIDFKEGSSEGGIFVWNEDRNYETSITASIVLNDWNFFVNDFKINYAQVLKFNKKAIAYNEFMGYKIASKPHENEEVIWMSQTKEDYIEYREKIIKLSFDDFNIEERVTEEDVFFEEHELERAQLFLKKLPLNQQVVYKRILNRTR